MGELTVEQDQELSDILSALAPHVDAMGEWDKKFTADQIERHKKYGSKMFMSPKQWEHIRRIHDETVGDRDPADDAGVDDEIPF